MKWPDRSLLDLLKIEVPILQAPMAGASDSALAIAVGRAGGLGSLPCAMLSDARLRAEVHNFRQHCDRPLNLNFFCHGAAPADTEREQHWQKLLMPYYEELQAEPPAGSALGRRPFDEAMCLAIEALKPEIVSFHFGLPAPELVQRVKAAGAIVISSATTIAEAVWLEDHDCDAVIAQGCEAGGHRGMFLTEHIESQPGTFALVPQVVDAVQIPVIAAGGIADARGVAAAFALGASGVQIGTAYLFTPEALITDLHRAALTGSSNDETTLTNVFSGKPARSLLNRLIRELGPVSDAVPHFPTAGNALVPLKSKAEAAGSADFSSLWSGQSAKLCRPMGAEELTRSLGAETLTRFAYLGTGE